MNGGGWHWYGVNGGGLPGYGVSGGGWLWYVVSGGGGLGMGHEASRRLDGPDGRDGPDSKDFPSLKIVIVGHVGEVDHASHLRPKQGRSQKCIVYKEPMKRTSERYDSESLRYEIKFY